MVMRVFALVVRGGARDLHHLDRPRVDQNPEGPVNRGDAQAGRVGPRRLPDLGRGEGAGGIIEGFLDSLALPGGVVHF